MQAVLRSFPIFLCLAICVVGLVGSIAAETPNDDAAVAAVFPPWWSAARDFAAAGGAGDIVTGGAVPFVLIVQSQRPGLNARLRAAGALLLLNPLAAGGCLQSSTGDQNV